MGRITYRRGNVNYAVFSVCFQPLSFTGLPALASRALLGSFLKRPKATIMSKPTMTTDGMTTTTRSGSSWRNGKIPSNWRKCAFGLIAIPHGSTSCTGIKTWSQHTQSSALISSPTRYFPSVAQQGGKHSSAACSCIALLAQAIQRG